MRNRKRKFTYDKSIIQNVLAISLTQVIKSANTFTLSGYLLQFAIMSLIAFIVAFAIILIINGVYDWVLWLLELLW